MSRLLEHAPSGIRFVLAGAAGPTSHSGVSRPRTGRRADDSDLRFTRPEIEEFFATASAAARPACLRCRG